MTKQETIAWTRPMLERFKRALAKNATAASFQFEGHEFVPAYGKYLVEYLEGQLAK